MRVYHGSNIVIKHPEIINRFKTLDFGEAFYTTENEEQAKAFAIKVCEMKDKNQISALLSVCIIPQIIAEIKKNYNNQEEIAIKEFYKSNLFEKLQNPNTGVWHLSPKTLSEIYLTEFKEKIIEFPEEQS
jgi:hypothetical protein